MKKILLLKRCFQLCILLYLRFSINWSVCWKTERVWKGPYYFMVRRGIANICLLYICLCEWLFSNRQKKEGWECCCYYQSAKASSSSGNEPKGTKQHYNHNFLCSKYSGRLDFFYYYYFKLNEIKSTLSSFGKNKVKKIK